MRAENKTESGGIYGNEKEITDEPGCGRQKESFLWQAPDPGMEKAGKPEEKREKEPDVRAKA